MATDFSGEYPPTEPDVSPGVVCGVMVSGGMMSYRCQISQGHIDPLNDVDDVDPEPHYTPEVQRTVRIWQEWAKRQHSRIHSPQPYVATAVASPAKEDSPDEPWCHMPECTLDFAHSHGTDVEVPAPPSTDHWQIVAQMEQSLAALGDKSLTSLYSFNRDGILAGEIHWPQDPHCQVDGSTRASHQRCFICRPIEITKVTSPLGKFRFDVVADPLMPEGSFRLESKPAQPTKTREGDQVLPTGGSECVQDIVIEAMEESKRVGTERYGQPLMTFNGRKGFQDIVEEARDFFVYASMVQREAEADRETLVAAVAQALETSGIGIAGDYEKTGEQMAAEVAVDRIMGWVVGQRGQEQSGA